MSELSRIGLILSMIGGILYFTLTYFFARHYYSIWKYGEKGVLVFLFYLFINGGAIIGGFLGFIGKSWQKLELVKIGCILCLLVGIGYPLWLLYNFLANPSTFFIGFFEALIGTFYISLPMMLLFIGGITNIIEWRFELRKSLVNIL